MHISDKLSLNTWAPSQVYICLERLPPVTVLTVCTIRLAQTREHANRLFRESSLTPFTQQGWRTDYTIVINIRDFRKRRICRSSRSIKKNIITLAPSSKYIHLKKVPWRLVAVVLSSPERSRELDSMILTDHFQSEIFHDSKDGVGFQGLRSDTRWCV